MAAAQACTLISPYPVLSLEWRQQEESTKFQAQYREQMEKQVHCRSQFMRKVVGSVGQRCMPGGSGLLQRYPRKSGEGRSGGGAPAKVGKPEEAALLRGTPFCEPSLEEGLELTAQFQPRQSLTTPSPQGESHPASCVPLPHCSTAVYMNNTAWVESALSPPCARQTAVLCNPLAVD